ncbi:hypothetical protein IWQ55_000301 [Labrenzia sp. EL_208]|nr:hypothetical protein [Labrenzia sp. EL_132]MBG6227109.1 hypothetical protein [Labrenzia sp. EL_208]
MPKGATTGTTSPAVSLFEDGSDNPAEGVNSSPAHEVDQQNEDELDLSSLAQDVIQKVTDESRGEDQSGDEAEGSQDSQNVEEQGSAEGAEGAEDEYSDVPFNNHPRFQELVREKNDFKAQVAELSPKAEQMDNITGFLEQNALNSQEAAEGLQIMGLMKLNPIEAWEKLKPIAQRVALQAGAILTPELAEKVRTGALTQEQAQQIAVAEARTLVSQTALAHDRNMRERNENQNRVNSLRGAASTWEADQKKKDADYGKKQKLILAEVALMHQQGDRPTDAAGVKAQLDKALSTVNKQLGVFGKPKPPVTPITGGNAVPPAGKPNAAEASTLDIIQGVTSQRSS